MAPHNYVEAIVAAGGAPLLIPCIEPYEEDPELALACLDGVVFMGGRDLDPRIYGAEPHPENDTATAARDRVELALGRAALEHPFCIGVQWHAEVTAEDDGGGLFRALVGRCS